MAPEPALIARVTISGQASGRFKLRTIKVIAAHDKLVFKNAMSGKGKTKTRFAPIIQRNL